MCKNDIETVRHSHGHCTGCLVVRKLVFTARSDTNRSVQPQKMARGLKFRIYVVEGLYYLYSKNKGADQLRIYCAADLRLCFHICKKQVFSQRGSNKYMDCLKKTTVMFLNFRMSENFAVIS